MTRLLVLGLDCAAPHLVFDRFADAMPNVSGLRARGVYGALRSVAPPITVPAWACMTTGLDPGELGIYGFRLRVADDYRLRVATRADVRAKHVWDRLGDAGHRVAPLFVPPSSPPPPVRGVSVSCFLTPDGAPFAFPSSLEAELVARFGPYRADVEGFRTDDKVRIARELRESLDQHFDIAAHILRTTAPDFAMVVEIATDRLHHAFFRDLDPAHPDHDPASGFRDVGRSIYARADERIGELLSIVGPDCDVLVVSDHGAKPMLGGFCINDFLIARGDLVLREGVASGAAVTPDAIDFGRTRAFAEGGYYGRVFVNLRDRDPQGIVDDADAYLDDLERALADVALPDGTKRWRFDRPAKVYRAARGFPPDAMVYVGDLDYRVLGTVGHDARFVRANDRGPDACNHAWDGIVVAAGPSFPARGHLGGASLLDVAPTILARFGLRDPAHRGVDLAALATRALGDV